MQGLNSPPWKYAVLWLRVYFGADLLWSGFRYLSTGWVPFIPGIGGQYVQALDAIHMFYAVKAVEMLAGILLLTNRYVLLGAILEFPTSISIFWINTFIVATPRQLFSGPNQLLMNGLILLAYGGYMANVFKPNKPLALWEGFKVDVWKEHLRLSKGAESTSTTKKSNDFA
ncbi:hypothetical protein BJG93_04630 [Paraburkholderia sprentiae WSM5005]|uniref:DoxX family protein n=1 Tax=Paraburkholderia sprentiae WSM5005 TaxID=754502 RepID=A0A1I9YEM0_9BURK|nr:hypothetical protein [Paraburkholderia sprentiae]APA84753.1 hypothetical protein BJG93_04630 [Paraburkholderia sprentiae WSM5005]